MKSFIVVLVLCLCIAFSAAKVFDNQVDQLFADFEQKFNRNYASIEERNARLAIFAENLERVKVLNAEHAGDAVFGVTKFMDLTPAEFKARYLTLEVPSPLPEAPKAEFEVLSADQLPNAFDWRNNSKAITPVKNQEQCGSCWAFSATESIEAAWVLAGNQQVILAPQQIVDCDSNDGGCGGGSPPSAFQYVIGAGGQMPENDYPYKGVQGACHFTKNEVSASITSWQYVSQTAADENTAMLTYVATKGPVSVCVDAAPWQYYQGGVLKSCGTSIDHAVQAVGYGVAQDGTPVWNVRNSWGEDWGEEGYIRVQRGKNLCEIAVLVTAAVSSKQ